MGRLWSLLFLTVPILGVAIFVLAVIPGGVFDDHWLPVNINEHGQIIDDLFMFILYLTGVIFIGTGILLFWFLWKYDTETRTEPVKYTHGSHTIEIIWSILPAATLLFIAIYQMDAWASHKMVPPVDDHGDPKPALLEVTGRQFEWRLRYAGRDGELYTKDDVFTVNDLHVPVNEQVVIVVKSQDVLHSFFLPNMRIKQDLIPGMKQKVWFQANQIGQYDLVCAELCGWGHYKMCGRLWVDSADDFAKWLEQAEQEQNSTEIASASQE